MWITAVKEKNVDKVNKFFTDILGEKRKIWDVDNHILWFGLWIIHTLSTKCG